MICCPIIIRARTVSGGRIAGRSAGFGEAVVRPTRRNHRRGLLGAALLALGSSPALPQDPAATGGEIKTAEAARTDEPITIDGRLDEEAWNGATVITDLHQILPVEFSEPSQRTEFLVLYDDDALFLAARMYDDQPDRVVAKVLRQGGMSWLDDQFNIILDPFNDKRSGYRFQVNPNGVWEEGLFRGGDQMQWEWSGIWQASASRNDEGWVAETRIPFKTVSFHPDNDTWGITSTAESPATTNPWAGCPETARRIPAFREKSRDWSASIRALDSMSCRR